MSSFVPAQNLFPVSTGFVPPGTVPPFFFFFFLLGEWNFFLFDIPFFFFSFFFGGEIGLFVPDFGG